MIKTPFDTIIRNHFWAPDTVVIAGESLPSEIINIFDGGEQGFAFDFNNLKSMFQDQAGTIPVTAAGQPIGRILDTSGNNNHAFQFSDTARPILQKDATGAYYIQTDGINDFLMTNAINFTAKDEISLFFGVKKDILSGGVFVELSAASEANNGSFNLTGSYAAGTNYWSSSSRGTATSTINAANTSDAAVISTRFKISTALHESRVNGVLKTTAGTQGTGNFGNYPLYIGGRAGSSLFLGGRIYALIGIGRLTTLDETIEIQNAIARRMGLVMAQL